MSASWERIWSLFEAVVARPERERDAFLASVCGDDPALRSAVEELLEADGTEAFLDRPLVGRTVEEAPPEPPPRRPRGDRIGPYRLLRRVGQGGMSTVYLAVRDDDAFHRRVVVKVVRRDMETEPVLRRLRAERQILAGLDHPYIARLYDGGSTEGGLPYFVLEYVEGTPIDDYCRRERLSIDEVLALFAKVCAAVQYAHQNLIVHRDLKPSNILVNADGEPRLLDFGIAKLLNPDLASAEHEPTATWQRVMTPSYASPEQVRGEPVTTASDVYSLGVLLYQLLTGKLPYRIGGLEPAEVERLLSETEPPAPSVALSRSGDRERDDDRSAETALDPAASRIVRRARRLRGDLDAIVLKALRSAPRRRYGSVEALAADLERFRRGLPVAAQRGGWRYRAGKLLRRHRAAAAVVAGAALLLIGFASAMSWQARRVAAERDQARLERDRKDSMLTLVLDLFADADPYGGGAGAALDRSVPAVLRRSVPLLESRLRAQPAARAQVLHTAGAVLGRLGEYEEARRLLTEALELRTDLDGEEHRDVAATMSALGGVLKHLGELERAETLTRRAVEILRARSDDPAELVDALVERVMVLCYRGDFEAAEAPAREALALARDPEVAGESQLILATELMAKVHAGRGEHREAAALYRQALALRRAHYGEQHPAQQATLHNLAFSLSRQGELAAAERTYLEVVELIERLLGADHPELAVTLNNLGGVRYRHGDFAGAEAAYRRALEMVRSSLGEAHWRVFFVALRAERARAEGGAAAAAEAELRRLVERWRPLLVEEGGGEHWVLAEAEGIVGQAALAQGRCADAAPLIESSYRRLQESGDRARADARDRLRRLAGACGPPAAADLVAALRDSDL